MHAHTRTYTHKPACTHARTHTQMYMHTVKRKIVEIEDITWTTGTDSVNKGREDRMKAYKCSMYKANTKVANIGSDSLCHH